MNKLKDIMTKSFEPTVIIKVESLDGKPVSTLLTDIHLMVINRYETMLDIENCVLYLRKKK
jgi:pentose-5-phosphate-3-epimerase